VTPAIFRDVPAWNGRRTAAIGCGAFVSAEAGADFLARACAELKGEGFEAVVGPMDGNSWGRYRLQIWSDGSPAFAMEPAGGPHDLAAYRAAGFEVAEEHVSASAAPGSRGWSNAGNDISIASWNGEAPSERLGEAWRVTMAAFRVAPFFTPIAEGDFIAQYLPLLERADPRFILLARTVGGELAGMTFAFPDPLRTSAVVLKTYAGLVPGAGRRMADRIHELAGELGYTEVIHALMRAGIASSAQSRKFGGRIFRRYALMGKHL
jgi:hypothetical protein